MSDKDDVRDEYELLSARPAFLQLPPGAYYNDPVNCGPPEPKRPTTPQETADWLTWRSHQDHRRAGVLAIIDALQGLRLAKVAAPAQRHVDNTPSCPVCGYAPQVRGCVAGKCGRGQGEL